MKPNPERGKGERELECSTYENCLEIAAVKNWPAFHCENCEYASIGGPSVEEIAEAEDGGDEVEYFGAVDEAEDGEGATLPDGAKPSLGAGREFGDCPNFDDCFEFAGGQGWGAFNCEACPTLPGAGAVENPEVEPGPEARICEDCGQRPTIGPNHSVCRSCLGRRGREKLRQKQEAAKAAKTAGETPGAVEAGRPVEAGQDTTAAGPVKAPGAVLRFEVDFKRYPEVLREVSRIAGGGQTLVIDFGPYPELFEAVARIAADEVRTPSGQVLYYLKQALSAEV